MGASPGRLSFEELVFQLSQAGTTQHQEGATTLDKEGAFCFSFSREVAAVVTCGALLKACEAIAQRGSVGRVKAMPGDDGFKDDRAAFFLSWALSARGDNDAG